MAFTMENISYTMDSLRSIEFSWDDVVRESAPRWPFIVLSLIVFFLTKPAILRLWSTFVEWTKGYGAIPQVPQLDRLLGLDMGYAMVNAAKTHTLLSFLESLHKKARSKTITYNFFGQRFVHTTEPENMKALFATPIWPDFGVGALRRNNHATMPFADKGVGTVDGEDWEFSRMVIKPFFAREAYTNVGRLEKHTDNLLKLVPEDGSTFDMQEMLQRWFLDTTTEAMFGESVGSLEDPAKGEVAWAMTAVLRGLRFRLMMVKLIWLFRQKAWHDAIDVVHKYIDAHIEKAYAQYAKKQGTATEAEKKLAAEDGGDDKPERTDLLWTMIPHFGNNREHLRSEMLILFAPNNDTTAILLANVFWSLARHPDVYAKVREDVLALGDEPLTYERLKSLKYVDAVLNETHRVFPVNITQTRKCIKESTLPLGGGRDQKQPIHLRVGDVVRVNKTTMFKDKDLWGDDADEFKPERMLGKRPDWKFMPFSGGPRRCPAQPTVTIESAYCIARFARKFKAIENRDPNLHYTPLIRVQPVHMNGVKIAAVPA